MLNSKIARNADTCKLSADTTACGQNKYTHGTTTDCGVQRSGEPSIKISNTYGDIAKGDKPHTADSATSPKFDYAAWVETIAAESAITPDLLALNTEFLAYQKLRNALFALHTPKVDIHYADVFAFGAIGFKSLLASDGFKTSVMARFKPVKPRIDKKGKPVKYESRLKPNKSAWQPLGFFQVTNEAWEKIAKRARIERPTDATSFWDWVRDQDVPVVLAEGEKKAMCLLSQGYAAISLAGIRMGCRTAWEDRKKVCSLHPDLIPFVSGSRRITICFDFAQTHVQRDQMRKAIQNQAKAIAEHGSLDQISVALPDGPETGIDDVWAKDAWKGEDVLESAALYKFWSREYWVNWKRGIKPSAAKSITKFTSKKYFSDACPALPEAGLVALVGTMGLGKTHLIEMLREENPDASFLNIGHLVNLLENLSNRLNTDIYSRLERKPLLNCDALSITVDSLYKLEKRERPYDIIFIDEVKQALEHMLTSTTCRGKRAQIIRTFEQVLSAAKLVVVADANVDTTTLETLTAATGIKPTVYWDKRLLAPRNVYWHGEESMDKMIDSIHCDLADGENVAIASDSKKTLKKLAKSFVDPESRKAIKEALRISSKGKGDEAITFFVLTSDNSGSKEGKAFLRNLRVEVYNYQCVAYSPSLGSGGDISAPKGMPDHFDRIYGLFRGYSIDAERCIQMLYRVRANVPMHVRVSSAPVFNNAPTTVEEIEEDLLAKSWISDFFSSVRGTHKTYLESFAWAAEAYNKFTAQRNLSMKNLDRDLKSLLINLGNNLIDCTRDDEMDPEESGKSPNAALYKAIGEKLNEEHYEAVAAAKVITEEQYKAFLNEDTLEPEQRDQVDRYRISAAYGIEDVTPEVVKIDKGGQFAKQLHYLDDSLAQPGPEVQTRAGTRVLSPPEHIIEGAKHEIAHEAFLPDHKFRAAKWRLRNRLGIDTIARLLVSGAELSYHDEVIKSCLAELSTPGIRATVKRVLGIHIAMDGEDFDMEPMQIVRLFTDQLGLPIKSNKKTINGSRIPVKSVDFDADSWAVATNALALWTQKRENKKNEAIARAARVEAVKEKLNQIYALPSICTNPDVIHIDPKHPDYKAHLEEIASLSKLGVDIETFGNDDKNKEGLHQWRGKVRLIQLAIATKTWVIDLGGRMEDREARFKSLSEFWEVFSALMADRNVLKIGQNFIFDISFLHIQYGLRIRNVACTLTGMRVFYGDYAKGESKKDARPILPGGYGLGNLVKTLLGVEIDKGEQSSDWGAPLTPSQIAYAALDPAITYQLYEAIERMYADTEHPLHSDSLHGIWEVENAVLTVAAEMMANGMPCDVAIVDKQIADLEPIEADLLAQWAELCPDYAFSQTQKVRAFINETYGLNLEKMNKAACAEHPDNPLIQLRLKLQGLKALRNNLEQFRRCAEFDGSVHSKLRTLTGFGRFAATAGKFKDLLNIQAISSKSNPAIKQYKLDSPRKAIRAGKGVSFGLCDLAAAHARIASDLANDETSIAAFNDPDIDNHSRVAAYVAKAVGKDWDGDTIAKYKNEKDANGDPTERATLAKSFRDTAKNTYYGFLNGAGALRLQEQIAANTGHVPELSHVEAARVGCQTLYPNIVKYQNDLMKRLEATTVTIGGVDYVISETRDGARILLRKVESRFNPGCYEAPFTQSLAATWTRIEATAMKKALIELQEIAETRPELELKLCGYIHDEINITCADSATEEVAEIMNNVIGDNFAAMLDKVSDGRAQPYTKKDGTVVTIRDQVVAESWAEK